MDSKLKIFKIFFEVAKQTAVIMILSYFVNRIFKKTCSSFKGPFLFNNILFLVQTNYQILLVHTIIFILKFFNFSPMENIFKNDLNEGNKIICTLNTLFKTDIKQKAIAQIIFQHTYPTLFKKERLQLVSALSFYLSCKICESQVKYNAFSSIFQKVFDTKISKDKFSQLEIQMSQMINFIFDVRPVHLYFLSLAKSLKIKIGERLLFIEKIHEDHRANYINYFSGVYDPELVALSLLNDSELDKFEVLYFLKVDRKLISEVRKIMKITVE